MTLTLDGNDIPKNHSCMNTLFITMSSINASEPILTDPSAISLKHEACRKTVRDVYRHRTKEVPKSQSKNKTSTREWKGEKRRGEQANDRARERGGRGRERKLGGER